MYGNNRLSITELRQWFDEHPCGEHSKKNGKTVKLRSKAVE